MRFPNRIDVFCRVVDNFGDIGVCLRLARQLAQEHGIALTLWVDDLTSFCRIAPSVRSNTEDQTAEGIRIRHWHQNFPAQIEDLPDVVIEAFACELPASYIQAMASSEKPPILINFEYLSAEAWVEDCHGLPSMVPVISSSGTLRKYFFFPGFTSKTGGLLCERDLLNERSRFQYDSHAAIAFLARLGIDVPEGAMKVSLFCYPHAPVETLLLAMRNGQRDVVCCIPEGVATNSASEFLQKPAVAGAHASRGRLSLHVLPFLPQADYDRLLWSCDLNFVRGEDSFVRAQWAARPFIWQIYPQEGDAHWPKLQAFIDKRAAGMEEEEKTAWVQAMNAWNGKGDMGAAWSNLSETLIEQRGSDEKWCEVLRANGDLGGNLLQFIRKIG